MAAFPALFVSHGAPTVALEEDDYTRALESYGRRLPRPRGIVVVSAHWEAYGPVRVNFGERPGLLYDFFGFPTELYQLPYPAPGSPDLAHEVAGALEEAGLEPVMDPLRGWDHGVWVPLRRLFPAARTPVVEVSLPAPRSPREVAAMGRALGPLREREVMLLGSGGIVHNLHRLDFGSKEAPVPDWASAFDAWVRDRLEALDPEALIDYQRQAPQAELAHSTSEHLDPVFFVLGSRAPADRAKSLYEGFHYGSLSMRCFALGAP